MINIFTKFFVTTYRARVACSLRLSVWPASSQVSIAGLGSCSRGARRGEAAPTPA